MTMTDSHIDIVMYHYVRPIADSPWPEVKGRELRDFEGQLEWLGQHRQMVGMDDLLAHLDAGEAFSSPSALLTFDDGLRDHYQYVFPLLLKHGVPAAFYPSSGPLADNSVLDVHRVQFILSAGADPAVLAQTIEDYVREHRLGDVAALRERYAHPSRWDPAPRVYVKRLLQVGLPAPARRTLISDLFRRFVSADEAAFSAELYCGHAELREMHDAGMHIGSHTQSHPWLSGLDADEQRGEFVHALRMLDDLGVDVAQGWTLAYPYGDFDASAVAIARDLGCRLALTVDVATVDITTDDRMRLPRLNTNDLPTCV